jgi:hypothetical protein
LAIGEHGGVFVRQQVRSILSGVPDVLPGRLGVQPFLDVTLGQSRPFGELVRGERSGTGHRLVEARPGADGNGQCEHRGAAVSHRASPELIDQVLVENLFH